MADNIEHSFLNFVKEYVTDVKFRKHIIFPGTEKYNEILKSLNGNNKVTLTRQLKESLKLTKIADKLVIVHKNSGKKILCWDDTPDVLRDFHDNTGHGGRDSTMKKIQEIYHYIPRVVVSEYLTRCGVCCSRKLIPKPVSGIPIYASGPMQRLQVDLIDMRSCCDANMKWIVHAKCHFSKFTWAQSMVSKECVNVCQFLRTIFHTFGAPLILQTDNGGEFIGNELKKMMTDDFPVTKVVHSRPRHPQTNGLIERANGTLERRIGAHIQETGVGWSLSLAMIVYQINTSYSRTIKATPFEVMFGRKPFVVSCNSEDVSYLSESGAEDEVTEKDEVIEKDEVNEKDEVIEKDKTIEAVGITGGSDVLISNETDISVVVDSEEVLSSSDSEDFENTNTQPYVLYEPNPPKLWAIGQLVEPSKLSCSASTRNHLEFQIVRVLCNDNCYYADDKPIKLGQFLSWPKLHANDKLGRDTLSVRTRLPSFIAYLQDRHKQGQGYNKLKKDKGIHEGDIVSLPIARVDRSNTCPTNLPCKVISINESGNLKLQAEIGVIANMVHQDKVSVWKGSSVDFNNCPSTVVSLIKATRSVTSYAKSSKTPIQVKLSLCSCRLNKNAKACDTKRCPCKRNSLACSTKCHPKIQCGNTDKV